MGFYGIYIYYIYIYILRFLYHFFDSNGYISFFLIPMGIYLYHFLISFYIYIYISYGSIPFRLMGLSGATPRNIEAMDSEAPVVSGEAPAVPTARQGGSGGLGPMTYHRVFDQKVVRFSGRFL